MTSRKSLFAFAAALAIATVVPLSALAAGQGSVLGASCDSGSVDLVDTADGGNGFFNSKHILNTTTVGTGRAGYELTITGLKPVETQGIGSGWQDCTFSYLAPRSGNTIVASDIHVDLYFNKGLTLTRTLDQLRVSTLRFGSWQSVRFDNTFFAGQGRSNLLQRVVIYQQNSSGSDEKRITFGDIDVNHFAQGGLSQTGSDVRVATRSNGCDQLGGGGGQGGELRNRFLSAPVPTRLRGPR